MDRGPTPTTLVTGMHRSGTSALTRCIGLLGIDLGTGPHLGATSTNVHGHWEPESVVEVDDLLLERLGGDWASPPVITAEALHREAAGDLGCRARQVIRDEYPVVPWAMKDPRASLVLDFWLEVVPAPVSVVLVVRHPEAVAQSLRRRDGLSIGHGLALWERHLRSSMRSLGGLRAAVVSYDEVVADPEGGLRPLQGWLLAGTDEQKLADAVASIDHGAVHETGGDGSSLSGAQQHLWEVVQGLLGLHEALPRPSLGPETRGIQDVFEDRRRLQAQAQRVAELEGRVEDLRARESELVAAVSQLEVGRASLAAEIEALVAHATYLDERLTDRQRLLDLFTVARIRRPLQDLVRRRRGDGRGR